MDIVNQKLGNVGDVHVSIVDGKLVVGVDGELDLAKQLEKLKAGHEADIFGKVIDVAEAAIVKLTAAPVTPSIPGN